MNTDVPMTVMVSPIVEGVVRNFISGTPVDRTSIIENVRQTAESLDKQSEAYKGFQKVFPKGALPVAAMEDFRDEGKAIGAVVGAAIGGIVGGVEGSLAGAGAGGLVGEILGGSVKKPPMD